MSPRLRLQNSGSNAEDFRRRERTGGVGTRLRVKPLCLEVARHHQLFRSTR
jgi:hypothetical protein